MTRCDVVVVGGGIAGVTAAAHLAERGAGVVLVERELQLATHTTGRSAAQYLENYGGARNVRLTLASREAFDRGAYLSPRASLTFGGPDDRDELRRQAEAAAKLVASIRFVEPAEALELWPALRAELVAGAIVEPDAADIDVSALHADLVARARRAGATVEAGVGAVFPRAVTGGWQVGEHLASHVVNAAGAWGDVVAAHASVRPIGLRPLRRTAFVVEAPEGSAAWPLVHEANAKFYAKPEPGGNLLVSPVDETPSDPCDARPEPVDIARALDELHAHTTVSSRHVRRSWAGLRTFAPDRGPVIGFDGAARGFFWLVGQGGTGIQTAPAQGRVAAELLLDGRLPADVAALGLTAAELSPARFDR